MKILLRLVWKEFMGLNFNMNFLYSTIEGAYIDLIFKRFESELILRENISNSVWVNHKLETKKLDTVMLSFHIYLFILPHSYTIFILLKDHTCEEVSRLIRVNCHIQSDSRINEARLSNEVHLWLLSQFHLGFHIQGCQHENGVKREISKS